MKYELSLTVHDGRIDVLDRIQADTLVHLCAQFVLVVAKLEQYKREELELARMALKRNEIDEDDIPF